MPIRPMSIFGRAVVLAALMLSLACGDDDDDASASGSVDSQQNEGSADADDTDDGDESEPLTPEEAREAGSPETYERIAALTDCDELTRERDTAQANADRRADDARRRSILLSYVEAAEERMEEVGCDG